MNTSNVVRCLLFTSLYMLHATTLASSSHMATFATPSFVLVKHCSYMHVANQFQYRNSKLQSSLQEPSVTVNDANNESTKSTSKSSTQSIYMPMDLLPPKENWEANSTKRLSRIELQKAMTKLKRFVESRLESDLNVFEVRCLVCVYICTWYSIYTRAFRFILCVTYNTLCTLYTFYTIYTTTNL